MGTRANHGQYSFNAGEWSPFMLGRQDLENYLSSSFVTFNFIPMVQGGITRRPGTLFLKTTKFGGTRESRLIRFEFGVTQAYMLEFGHEYIRFFTNGGILAETGQTPTAITQANPGVMTIGTHGYSDGDRLHLAGIGGMTQLEGQEVIVANSTTNTFELQDIYGNNLDTSGYDAFTSGGTASKIIEITTTYEEADLDEIRVTQSADVLYIFHPDFKPRKLVRETATSWTLSEVDFFDGPYGPLNEESTTLQPSGTAGSITITASAVDGINDGDGFISTDVGRLIRIEHSGTWGYAEITAITSTTEVDADVVADFGASTASDTWRLGLFSDTTGFPANGTFYEDRLFVAGSALAPQRLDGSRSGRYENFRPTETDGTVADDHAVGFTLASARVNRVRWMEGDEKGLLVGTAGAEWIIRPSLLSEALSPTNINANQTTVYGSANIAAERIGDSILYVQRSKLKVRELTYVFEKDGFRSPDMSTLAEHITLPSVTEIAHAQNPQSILWATRSDGVLLGFTYERDHGVLAWHRHELGGVSAADGTITEVESVAVVPSPDGTVDDVYLIVKRYINGQTERYVEQLTDIWAVFDEQTLAFHVDAGITVTDAGGFTEITGLWHLEGESVTIFADGAAHADKTVTNGKVTLDRETFIASVGKGYNSDVELMPIEVPLQEGTAQGLFKKISRISFWLVDTLGLKYGPDENTLTEILFSRWGDTYGDATPLFTGVARVGFEGDHDRLGQVYVRADGAFPCNLLSVQSQVKVEEDS